MLFRSGGCTRREGVDGRGQGADAGAAVSAGIPLLLVRAPELIHALKELDAMASFTVETLEQAAEAIAYIFE